LPSSFGYNTLTLIICFSSFLAVIARPNGRWFELLTKQAMFH